MISVITTTIRPKYLDITQKCLMNQTFKDFEWIVIVGFPDKHTLSADMNRAISQAKGDRIVILQDCITIEDNALEEINKLSNDFFTFPVIKEGKKDWRAFSVNDREVTGNMWEMDFSCAPKKAFYDIGGFDERFDEGWSWDNVEVGWRVVAAGYKIYCKPHIIGNAIDHDRIEEHPFRSKLPLNGLRANESARRAEIGDYKLNYL